MSESRGRTSVSMKDIRALMATYDPFWPKAISAERLQEAARLMLEALLILDEEGSPAAARLSMVLDDLGIAVPAPRLSASTPVPD